MVGNILGLVLALLVFQNVGCEDPPVVKNSYIAWGEVVQPAPETEDLIVIQTAFEESYDASTQNAAFFMWLAGKNLTFIKNFKLNQTFLYVETDKKEMKCTEATEKEWMESDFAPGLLSYEDDDGTIKFSLTQLFNIPTKYLKDEDPQGVTTTYRGVPAKVWFYEIRTEKKDDEKYDHSLAITAYWSDDTWNLTSGKKVTPLGFNVSKITWSDPVLVEDYVISVFGFVPDAYDHKYFEPYQGIICETRKSLLKFPDVKNLRAISLHSEMALVDDQELRYIDTWFDPVGQLLRIDLERMKDENPMERKSKHYQSEISIGKMGVVFRWGYYKGEAECEVISFDKYENDLQNLFDVKQSLKRWNMGRLFGLNDTSYVYIGKTTKNDIPCHLFQGIRKEWPDAKSKVTSLWEWCFNVNMSNPNDIVMFLGDEFGLISADVTILSHPNPNFKNFQMSHHFYEVAVQDPKILDATSFDIGRCFQDTQKRLLQFYVDADIGEDNRHLYDNATSDVNFLQKWKSTIYRSAGLPEFSLRVSNVRATIDDHKLYIKFSILPPHEKLPAEFQKINGFDAEKNVRDSVNAGKMAIKHKWDNKGKTIDMAAVKNSVTFQIDPKFNPRTLPPPPPTTPTTPFVFTLRPEPTRKRETDSTASDSDVTTASGGVSTDGSSTVPGKGSTLPIGTETTTASPKKVVQKAIGHGSGSVAGVSIAMLLVGLTIGASGTFYKFNGLPACLSR